MLGLLGGWIVGGICMKLTWNTAEPWISGLKVLGAATAGSLLGTFLSWFMPGTRRRMQVIRELKVHLEERRLLEEAEEALPESNQPDRRSVPAPPLQAVPVQAVAQGATARPGPQYYQSKQAAGARPVVQDAPVRQEPVARRPLEIDRVERQTADGSQNELLKALEKFGHESHPDDDFDY